MTPILRPTTRSPLLLELLHRRFQWFHEAMMGTLPELGLDHLTSAQCRILTHIDGAGTRTAELARRLGVSRQAAHQQVRELERRGLVDLRPDPTSRSAKLVVHAETGADAARQLRYLHRGMEELLSDRIGEDGVGALARALETDWGSPLPPYPEHEAGPPE